MKEIFVVACMGVECVQLESPLILNGSCDCYIYSYDLVEDLWAVCEWRVNCNCGFVFR